MKEKEVNIPLYGGVINIVFTDKSDDLVEFFVQNKDYYNADHAEEDKDIFGVTYRTMSSKVRSVMMVFNPNHTEWRTSVIVHEVMHATDIILENIGHDEKGEPFAYLADWIANEVFEFAKKENIKIY